MICSALIITCEVKVNNISSEYDIKPSLMQTNRYHTCHIRCTFPTAQPAFCLEFKSEEFLYTRCVSVMMDVSLSLAEWKKIFMQCITNSGERLF